MLTAAERDEADRMVEIHLLKERVKRLEERLDRLDARFFDAAMNVERRLSALEAAKRGEDNDHADRG